MIFFNHRQRLIGVAALAAALIFFLVWKPAQKPAARQNQAASAEAAKPAATHLLPAPEPASTPATPPQTGPVADLLSLVASTPEAGQKQLIAKLAGLGAGAVGDLGAAMRAAPGLPSKSVFAQALVAIGNSEAVDQMIASLREIADPAKQKALVQTFGGLTNSAGLETLTSSLAAVEGPLSQNLVQAIAQLATDDTVNYLAELYRAPPNVPSQDANIEAALSSITNPDAVIVLRQLASEAPELPLQYAAVRALTSIGTPDALEGVISAAFRVGNTNPDFRQALLTGLENVTNPQSIDWLRQQSASSTLPADITAALGKALARLQ